MSNERVKLTHLFIDQLELTPAIYRDSELIGFAVRVNTSYKSYVVEKKVLGKTVRSSIGIHGQLSLAQAREIAHEKLIQMSLGINPNDEKRKALVGEKEKAALLRKKPTLADAFAVYIDHKQLKERTLRDYDIVVNKYLSDWRNSQLDEISRTMIQMKHIELSQKSKA